VIAIKRQRRATRSLMLARMLILQKIGGIHDEITLSAP
jgi:hypothetical protein